MIMSDNYNGLILPPTDLHLVTNNVWRKERV